MAQQRVTLPRRQLPCNPHTTYYSDLFVLKTKVVINGQQAELAFSKDGELTLNCRYPSTKCLTLNYHTISAELESIFRKHGVNHVNNCWCDELVLYFQVSFRSQEYLCDFLRSQRSVAKELSTLLSQRLSKSQLACSPLLCEAETKLFLIIVDTQMKETKVKAVSEDNYNACLTIWRESAQFDFGSLFRIYNREPEGDLVNDEINLPQLDTELVNVVEWFGLGMHLGVPEPNLLEIKADHQGITRGRTVQCKRAMLGWWLKNREVSWSAVVRALEKIEMAGLAQKIATKYGVSMLQATVKEQPSVTERDHERTDELTTAASSLDDEMDKKVSISKRRAQEDRELNESSVKIKNLTEEQEERRMELVRREQELILYTQLQQELTTQKSIEHLKVKIARKKEKIKHLKGLLDRVEKELSQAREESKQQREQIQQTRVDLALQSEKTRNLKRKVAKLKREREEKDQELMLSVAKNQGYLHELRASTDKEVETFKQEIEEKESTIRDLSSQLEVKKAEEKRLQESQLAQMAAEITELTAKLDEAEDGKMRSEEELKDLQNLQQAETLWPTTDILYPHQQPRSASFEAPPTSSQSQPDRVNIDIERGPLGFGFSLSESPNGPVVKQIMDHPRCGQLKEGDVILEINGESTRNYLHSDLLTVLEGYLQATFTVLHKPHHQEEDSRPESVMQQMVAAQTDNHRNFQHGYLHDGDVGTQISADFEPGFQTKFELPDKPKEDSQPESVMQQMVAAQTDNHRNFQHGYLHDGDVGIQISADCEPGFQTKVELPDKPKEDSQPESVMQQMVATQMDNRRNFQHGCQHDGDVGTQISADFEPGFQTKVELPDKPKFSADLSKELKKTQDHLQLLVQDFHPRVQSSSDSRLMEIFPGRHSTYIASTHPHRRHSRKSVDQSTDFIPIPLFILGNHYTLNKKLYDLLSSEEPLISSSSGNNGINSTSPYQRRQPSMAMEVSFESDSCIDRALVPLSKFEINPELPEFTSSKDEPGTPIRPPRKLERNLSNRPKTTIRKFVLQMLKPDVDHQFIHLYLKGSGIFLVVIGLDDLVSEPLIQYENLFHLLRLIHTHVKPSDIKRIIVIGMYQSSKAQRHHHHIPIYVNHLNAAIRAHVKQSYPLPLKEGGFVFTFNMDHPQTELVYLCACIRSLMDVFMDRAWYYCKPFFETVFLPFDNFGEVLMNLTQSSRDKVVQSSANILKYVGVEVPDKYFETLAMLSPALIASPNDVNSDYSILQPSFIPKLLDACAGKRTDHDDDIYEVEGALKDLPVVDSPFLYHHMKKLGVTNEKEQNAIIRWMKSLDLIHSIATEENQVEIFFVPFLANEDLSPTWDKAAVDSEYNTLTVYALLKFPATDQFFHKLLALLLSDIYRNSDGPSQFHCQIAEGCSKAILPLMYVGDRDSDVTFEVLLKYHAIQNIIEVKTKQNKAMEFLKAIEDKLFEVLKRSKYEHMETPIFHTPAAEFSQATQDSPVWQLGCVSSQVPLMSIPSVPENGTMEGEEEEEEEEPQTRTEDVLLKTKFLALPGFREARRNNVELIIWASSDSGIKSRNFPADLLEELEKTLASQHRYWSIVAAHMGMSKVDIDYYATNPVIGGNGRLVLNTWRESNHTYQDLVEALKRVRLEQLAMRVEQVFQENDQPDPSMLQTVVDNHSYLQHGYRHVEAGAHNISKDVANITTYVSYEETHHIEIRHTGSGFRFWQRRRDFGFVLYGRDIFRPRNPLAVMKITKGGAAEKDGRLRVDDALLEINGKSTKDMSHSDAITIIQHSGKIVKLVVGREKYKEWDRFERTSIIISDEDAERLLRENDLNQLGLHYI